jgi:hypothetical protein
MCYRNFYFITITTILIVFPNVSYANVGIPIIAIGETFMVLLLIPVILIEFFVYYKKLNKDVISSLKVAAIANISTTVIGYPLSWILLLFYQILMSLFLVSVGRLIPDIEKVSFPEVLIILVTPAWIAPYENYPINLMICLAGIVGLIPAYYITLWFEYPILKKFWGNDENIKSGCVLANRLSYSLLLLILIFLFFYFFINQNGL